MCLVGSVRWQSELLDILSGNVCCWVFHMAICIVASFRWQCVLLGLLGGKMSCYML